MTSESATDNQTTHHAVFNCGGKNTCIEETETKTTKGADAPTEIMSHMSELDVEKQNEQGPRGARGVEGEPGEDHHPLGPSALKYIEICPGYRSSGGTSPAAAEGTKLHAAVENENLEGLDEEQVKQCESVLAYVTKLRKGASAVIKEKKLEIRYA